MTCSAVRGRQHDGRGALFLHVAGGVQESVVRFPGSPAKRDALLRKFFNDFNGLPESVRRAVTLSCKICQCFQKSEGEHLFFSITTRERYYYYTIHGAAPPSAPRAPPRHFGHALLPVLVTP